MTSGIIHDRTPEFFHRRGEAKSRRSRERFEMAAASYARRGRTSAEIERPEPGVPAPAPAPARSAFKPPVDPAGHQRSQSTGGKLEWLWKPFGIFGAPSSPAATSPPTSPAPPAAATSPTSCPACGRTYGLLVGKQLCKLCNVEHCRNCCVPVFGVFGASSAFMCCPRCRSIVSDDASREDFHRRVKEAMDGRLPRMAAQISATKNRLDGEMAKFEHLAGSITDQQPKQGSTFEVVVDQQKVVGGLLHALEELLKALTSERSWTPGEARLAGNIRSQLTDEMSSMLLQYRRLTEKLLDVELQTATNAYVVVYRCRMEAKDNKEFERMFGQKISAALQVIQKDLHRTVLDRGADWTLHKKRVDEMIVTWDRHSKSLISDEATSITGKSSSAVSFSSHRTPISTAPAHSVAPSNQNVAGTEGRMMRRAIEVFSHSVREIESKIGFVSASPHQKTLHIATQTLSNFQEKLVDTRMALAGLIDEISAKFKV